MRWISIPLSLLLCLATTAQAQQIRAGAQRVPNVYYQPPGLYGMAYGSPSFGVPLTYSVYSSPYGAGYAYGYAPYSLIPGQFGMQLWRPGNTVAGYVYGSSYYYTYSYPARIYAPQPPVGAYAPGFGPPIYRGP